MSKAIWVTKGRDVRIKYLNNSGQKGHMEGKRKGNGRGRLEKRGASYLYNGEAS